MEYVEGVCIGMTIAPRVEREDVVADSWQCPLACDHPPENA